MLRLDLEVSIRKGLVYVAWLVIFCLPCSAHGASNSGNVSDMFGSVLDVLHFNYRTQLSEQDVIKCDPLRLKIDGLPLESEIFAEVRECHIGNASISARSVRVSFDRQQNLRLRMPKQMLEINAEMDNPTHAVGPVRCDFISVRASTVAAPLIEAKVYGEVAESPSWDGAIDRHINAVQFSFSGMTSQPRANLPVESQAVSVTLRHPVATPASVLVSRPQLCKIGEKAIRDQDVSLLIGTEEVSSDRQILFMDGQMQSMRLRFNANGGYGKAHGNVTCEKSGGLIYGY